MRPSARASAANSFTIRGPAQRVKRETSRKAGAFLSLMACACCFAEPAAKPPLTVADAIGTARFMVTPRAADPRGSGVVLSPDGKRYVVMLIRGDVKRNGNWVELWTGGVESFEQASQPPRRVAQLFLSSLGEPGPGPSLASLTQPGTNVPRWLNDHRRVAFFWPEKDVIQVATVDTDTGELVYLTHQPRHVRSFDFTPRGELLYSALVPHSRERSEQLLREGFKAGNSNLFDLMNGDVDGNGVLARSGDAQWFIRDASENATARPIRVDGIERDRAASRFPALPSPDGSLVLMDHFPPEVPDSWHRYTDTASVLRMEAYRANPNDGQARQMRQLIVVDVASGRGRALWSAPTPRRGTEAAWSPDGRAVLLAPVLLPLAGGKDDPEGLAGTAVAEVNVADGRFRKIAVPAEYAAEPVRRVSWPSARQIEIVQQTRVLRFRKSGAQWKFENAAAVSESAPSPAAVRMEWRQDLNTPPVLYAVAADGRATAVLDPNPGLVQRFALGRVEMVDWQDAQGRKLRARLYRPVPETNERVPLVIQTHGYAPENEFSLYGYGNGRIGGMGLGPVISAYAAQPLAGRGIAVLHVADPTVPPSPEEPELQMKMYESAVEHLAQRGLVDPERVGLQGHSRTGWHVLYALTRSKRPFAAALVSDNIDMGYLQAAVLDWTPEFYRAIGAEPFGEGLQSWLARSPGFNIDKLGTPLRMQLETGGLAMLFGPWEVYSRARRLGKTVELFVIPDIEHGSHFIQNPAQCLASQQGAVDWFDSWLRPKKN